MVNTLDLAKYTEDDDDDDSLDETQVKKHQKRSEWAKGKSRAQPSENWDSDFLFGSASTESLPLPDKAPPPRQSPLRKPGSAQSTQSKPSSALPTPLGRPHQQQPAKTVIKQQSRQSQRQRARDDEDDSTPVFKNHSSVTPRKASINTNRPHLSVPPTFQSPSASNNSIIPTPIVDPTPHAARPPPCSAPNSSRTLNLPPHPPQKHSDTGSKMNAARAKDKKPSSKASTRPPSSLRGPSHKTASSQDSVPSMSDDMSSIGFRSPSSTLSTTDDSRGDWSRSSGDYSLGSSGKVSRGNRSFNTETEFTEPETELDWGDDCDFEHRSTSSPLLQRNLLSKYQPAMNSTVLRKSGSIILQSMLSDNNPSSVAGDPASNPTQKLNNSQSRRPAHSSFDSQATCTTQPPSKPKTNHHPLPLNSLSSSSSSIGYHKSNHSDVSLNSSLSRPSHQSEMLSNNLSQNHQAHLRRQQQMRTPSHSSSSSNFQASYRGHSSDSYDVVTSGTETDGISDTLAMKVYHQRNSPVVSTASSTRATPSASQRQRKQALYSRPSYVDTSSSASSLTNATSSSTLNSSSLRNPSDHLTDDGDDSNLRSPSPGGGEGRLKNLRRKLKKKRPSVLALNPPPIPSSSTNTVIRRPSVAESIYSDDQLSGDLAFAADSDDESRLQSRNPSRTVSKQGPSSPFEMIDKSELLSINLRSPTPISQHRGLNFRARSSVSHHSSTNNHHSQIPLTAQNPSKETISSPDPVNQGKKPKTRRPISFTALLSRNSMVPLSPSRPSPNFGDQDFSYYDSSGNVSGVFVRKSTETVRDPTTSASPSTNLLGQEVPHSASDLPRERHRGHSRQAASFGSSHQPPRPNQISLSTSETNESFISRVRRLSARHSMRRTTPPATPSQRKRFSIIGGGGSNSSSRIVRAVSNESPPISTSISAQSISAASTPSHKRNHRSATVVTSICPSVSVSSEMTVKAHHQQDNLTLKGKRPSSRGSDQNRSTSHTSSRGSSLRSKFSTHSNNKSTLDQPNVTTISPTYATLTSSDHNLSSSTSSSTTSSHLGKIRNKSMGLSKPPKSNPALRKKVAASLTAGLNQYQMTSPPPSSNHPRQSHDDHLIISPKSPEFELDSIKLQRHRLLDQPIPSSDPSSDFSPGHIPVGAVAGNSLGRSNSMGELRIPSRITSQQGRLHNELNQMKEFARGVDELKSMRRNYRKLIQSTTRHTSAPSTDADTSDEMTATTTTTTDTSSNSDGDSVQRPSPRALARLSSTIARIELSYREWWTCCNVLIDLGDGEKDPRNRISPERSRAFSCNPSHHAQRRRSGSDSPPQSHDCLVRSGTDQHQDKHFEILRNMFGPGVEPNVITTPPRALTSVESFDRTPMVTRRQRLEDSGYGGIADGPVLVTTSPETPTVGTCRLKEDGQMITNDDDNDDDDDDGSVKGKSTRTVPHPDNVREDEEEGGRKIEMLHVQKKNGKKPNREEDRSNRRPQFEPDPGNITSKREASPGLSITESDRGSIIQVVRSVQPLKQRSVSSNYAYSTSSSKMLSSSANGSISSSGLDSIKFKGRLSGSGTARTALQGVKDFLKTLKAKMQEDKLNSKSTPTSSTITEPKVSPQPTESPPVQMKEPSPSPSSFSTSSSQTHSSVSSSSSSSEEENWDDQINEPIMTTSLGYGKKRLALSSERMPQLLSYMAIVKEQCESCLDELKSHTI